LEIALLKDTLASQDETVRQKITEELENLLNGEDFRSLVTLQRNKRPVRLLPFHFLMGDRKKSNSTSDQSPIPKFYGPATNCSDLALLGYTLNGYYLVKPVADASHDSKATSLETVYCSFKQPESFNSSTVEKRIGHLNVLDGTKPEPNSRSSSTKGILKPNKFNLRNHLKIVLFLIFINMK